MSGHPQDLSLRDQAKAVAAGELSSAELLDATLARIDELNPTYNAIAATFADESRAMSADAPAGPLSGVPVTVKDMFSLPWRGYRNGTPRQLNPAGASGVFRRLRDAGAVIVGVDNQHELGLGTTGLVSAHGPSRNPVNPAHCTADRRAAPRPQSVRGWSVVRSAVTAAGRCDCPPGGAESSV